MKRLLLLLMMVVGLGIANGQDLKRVHMVYVDIDNKNPDKNMYGDDKIAIKFLKIDHDNFKIQLTNLTDDNMEFVGKKSYTVIDGVASLKISPYTYTTNEIIPKKTNVVVNVYPGALFDYQAAKKFYKENNKPIVNKLILSFKIDNKEKDIPFEVNIYPKKVK